MKYTVTINQGEFAEGLFDSYTEAEDYLVQLLKNDEWISEQLTGEESREDILEWNEDGKLQIMDIALPKKK